MGDLRSDPSVAVRFKINDQDFTVSESDGVSSSTRLVSYIRDTALLKGTKIMCHEGGCGACLVTAYLPNGDIKAVNSCLTPVLSCDGWKIYTVEFLGNSREGYDKIQKKVVYHSGTQCGFCTPGMVMNMYSLMAAKPAGVTMDDVENGFDGNICRCTGYRSILDAMKSLATDAPDTLKVEDGSLSRIPMKGLGQQNGCCGAVENCCRASTVMRNFGKGAKIHLRFGDNDEWVQPKDMDQLFDVMKGCIQAGEEYRFIAGNTGSGVYAPPPAQVKIDITALPLDECSIGSNSLMVGACTPLVKLIETLNSVDPAQFAYAKLMAQHISRVASTPVRNRATVAGNLTLKRLHPEFQSDIFTILETVGTSIEITSVDKITSICPLRDILAPGFDMKGKIITALSLPKRAVSEYQYRSYKISKRFQNAHAYVNAGFLFKIDAKFIVTEKPSICYAGITGQFVHATKCEEYLNGKPLNLQQTLDEALDLLDEEVVPDPVAGEADPKYRKTLAKALLYKAILSILGEAATPSMRSGGTNLERVNNKGTQKFPDHSGDEPLYKPVRKIEAIHQTSGEAEYIADLPHDPNELVGVFLLSKEANATLESIDATEALKVPGVVAFYQAKDIPGVNNYMKFGIYGGPSVTEDTGVCPVSYSATSGGQLSVGSIRKKKPVERYGLCRSVGGAGGSAVFRRLNQMAKAQLAQAGTSLAYSATAADSGAGDTYTLTQEGPDVDTVFASDKVSYFGQALGLIVATSRGAASQGLALIKVNYVKKNVPKLDLKKLYNEAKQDGTLDEHNAMPNLKFEAERKGNDVPFMTIDGNFKNGGQYHYHMETQSCFCIPKEDSIDVYAGTQWMEHTQYVVASLLDIPHHKVNVEVRRLGGGFGAKLTRNSAVAAACALAAYKLGKPVRVSLDMSGNMDMIGKRTEYFTDYKVQVNKDGKILSLNADISCGTGFTPVESDNVGFCIPFVQNAYACDGWKLTPYNFVSNTASNTSTRGPGSVNGVSIIEYIMDHIAFMLKKDPLDVRSANYATPGDVYLSTKAKMSEDNKIPEMMAQILQDSSYNERKVAVAEWNKNNRWKKRGLSALPVKFLIEYLTAKFTVFVAIYHFDGTVSVTHPGIEMGQGVNTKVAQTVAYALGIDLHLVNVKPSNNMTGANSFLSGASFTSELCCYAALKACEILNERMATTREQCRTAPWIELVKKCFANDVDLAASYMQKPGDLKRWDGDEIVYPVWIVAVTEVELDILTGENRIIRVDILQDVGKSLSPEIDIGQMEGGFVMGLGFFTTEQLIWDDKGKLLTTRSWNYKPPQTRCIPQDFRITILANTENPNGVLGSKTTGEPTLVASFGVVLAIKDAIHAARKDAGNTDWFQLDTPVTPEDIVRYAQVKGTEYLV